jgi:predicted nucleic acid-binding protein
VILLDTSVVSAVLRRKRKGAPEDALAGRLATLLQGDQQVGLPGIVLQEVLSGIAERSQHETLMARLREGFPVILATEGDHLLASDLSKLAARKGLALATPDALIAAQAINRHASLFTTDIDFARLAWSGLKLL